MTSDARTAAETAAKSAEPVRLLLVDDDATLLSAMARPLRRAGLSVTTAPGAEEALSMLRAVRFDVLVTDIAMPGMNGIDLSRCATEVDPHIQTLLITGAPTLDRAVAAIDQGVFKFLQKPLDAMSLVQSVFRAAALCRVAREESRTVKPVASVAPLSSDHRVLTRAFDAALASASVAYQPIVRADQGGLFGYEAFVRSGDASIPDALSFLRAGERLGRLPELGRFVRSTVQAQAAALAGHPLLFINLHPADLLDPELVDWGGGLRQIACRVVLEISEHSDLTSIPNAALRVGSLHKMGFRIALDDIGAADAGILPFSRLDPDFLKLDVSLVRGVEDDDAKRRVVSAVTGFARDLRMHVVAEGVETIAESRALSDLGCDLLQGYLFARPGPVFPEVNWPHSPDEPRALRKVSGEVTRVR